MLLFRHPHAGHNVKKGYFDGNDSLPTPLGELQSPEIIDFLAEERVAILAVSSKQRARKTLEHGDYGQPHVPPIRVISSDFDDLFWGEWAGRAIAEVITEPVQKEIDKAGVDFIPPGGQSFTEKGTQFLQGLKKFHSPDAVIAHQLSIATAVGTALGWNRNIIRNFKLGHGEAIYFDPEKPRAPERVFIPAAQLPETQM